MWCRPVGEFKKGERRMLQRSYRPKAYRSLQAALKARERFREDVSSIGFVYQKGRKPRKITEIQIWFDENYSAE
jgi:hypothetical protein